MSGIEVLERKNCQVSNSGFNENAQISIGEGCDIQRECLLDYTGNLIIGNHVDIGLRTLIYTHSHQFKNPNWRELPTTWHELIINDFAFIGANCIILPSVHSIGKHSVVGAGSVVSKNVPDYGIWAGNPAEKIGDVKR